MTMTTEIVDDDDQRLETVRRWLEEGGDNLQRTIAAALARNPHLRPRFIPGISDSLLGCAAELTLGPHDEPSALDMGSVVSLSMSMRSTVISADGGDRGGRSSAIDGSTDGSSSSSDGDRHASDAESITSARDGQVRLSAIYEYESPNGSSIGHGRMRDPADVPVAAAAPPVQDTESNMNGPTLEILKNLIEQMCNINGPDEVAFLAIDILREELVRDNDATARYGITDRDKVIFCLAKLRALAERGDDNKRMMITGGITSTFEAVLETAKQHPGDVDVQRGACDVLRSLSNTYPEHVARNGGGTVMLNAMNNHVREEGLQLDLLVAFKALSSVDGVDVRTWMSSYRGLTIVANVMRTYAYNPEIQAAGCAILGELVVDGVSAITVSENEVDAIINGMIACQYSLEVQGAA